MYAVFQYVPGLLLSRVPAECTVMDCGISRRLLVRMFRNDQQMHLNRIHTEFNAISAGLR